MIIYYDAITITGAKGKQCTKYDLYLQVEYSLLGQTDGNNKITNNQLIAIIINPKSHMYHEQHNEYLKDEILFLENFEMQF